METARSLWWLTGINCAGHRHVQSTYYNGSKMATERPWRMQQSLSMLALSTALLALFLRFGLSKMVAKGCTVAVTMAISFAVNRLWVFRPNQQTKDA